jgi:hypothetical protein
MNIKEMFLHRKRETAVVKRTTNWHEDDENMINVVMKPKLLSKAFPLQKVQSSTNPTQSSLIARNTSLAAELAKARQELNSREVELKLLRPLVLKLIPGKLACKHKSTQTDPITYHSQSVGASNSGRMSSSFKLRPHQKSIDSLDIVAQNLFNDTPSRSSSSHSQGSMLQSDTKTKCIIGNIYSSKNSSIYNSSIRSTLVGSPSTGSTATAVSNMSCHSPSSLTIRRNSWESSHNDDSIGTEQHFSPNVVLGAGELLINESFLDEAPTLIDSNQSLPDDIDLDLSSSVSQIGAEDLSALFELETSKDRIELSPPRIPYVPATMKFEPLFYQRTNTIVAPSPSQLPRPDFDDSLLPEAEVLSNFVMGRRRSILKRSSRNVDSLQALLKK